MRMLEGKSVVALRRMLSVLSVAIFAIAWTDVGANGAGTPLTQGEVRKVGSLSGPSDWTTFQGNVLHTGYNDKDGIALPITRSWWRKVHTCYLQAVTVIGDHIIVSSHTYCYPPDSLVLICLDAQSGSTLWKNVIPDFMYARDVSQISYSNGIVYFLVANSGTSELWACDLVTGAVQWKAPYYEQATSSLAPAVSNGKVVFTCGTYGGIGSWDALTGSQDWWIGLPQIDRWTPAIWRDTVYFGLGRYIHAMSLDSGDVAWSVRVGTDPFDDLHQRSAPAIDTVRRVLYSCLNDELYALDLDSKNLLWKRPGAFAYVWPIRGTAICDGVVYAVDTGNLVAFDGLTGERLWKAEGDTIFTYPPVIANGLVFVASDSQTIATDAGTGAIVWSCRFGGFLSIANNTLYIASADGTVHLYKGAPVETSVDPSPELPDDFQLTQNYPNPFNPSTTIEFTLPTRSHVLLKIYDVLGREVITLVDQRMSMGLHTVSWPGTDFSGVPAGWPIRLRWVSFCDLAVIDCVRHYIFDQDLFILATTLL